MMAVRRPELVIAEWPTRAGQLENPYRELLDSGLKQSFTIDHMPFEPNGNWAQLVGRDVDIVHIHWPESLWRGHQPGEAVDAVERLRRTLKIVHRNGGRVVFTVHNHGHHDGPEPGDTDGYRMLFDIADLVLCHSQMSKRWVREQGRRRNVMVMPIGTYAPVHTAGRGREDVVRQLGLDPNVPLVVCPGQLRNYKGLSVALDACALACGAWQLAVVGRPGPGFDLDAFRRQLDAVGHATLVNEHVGDELFGELLAAADVVALPYTGITSSSVPPAAWAVGTPIVASRLPYFEEILEPWLGEMFETGHALDLDRAVRDVLAWPALEVARATAARTADLDWSKVTGPLRARYARWVRVRPIRLQALRTGRIARRAIRKALAKFRRS